MRIVEVFNAIAASVVGPSKSIVLGLTGSIVVSTFHRTSKPSSSACSHRWYS
jgi:hypothetical protein